jgi:hypothetical protein
MSKELCAALTLFFLAADPHGATAQSFNSDLVPVSRANLCLTEGDLQVFSPQQLSVDEPKMRAYVDAQTPPVAELRFTYLGPTVKDAPLGSGEMRRQFGLKLHAQDACNLVYVMWRFEPESKIVVSVKNNPGQHTSAECGNRGYQNIKPHRSSPVPAIQSGQPHTLAADLQDRELRVFADNVLAWEGSLDGQAVGLNGPVGMRSDNARLRVTLSAPPLPSQHLACRGQESE